MSSNNEPLNNDWYIYNYEDTKADALKKRDEHVPPWRESASNDETKDTHNTHSTKHEDNNNYYFTKSNALLDAVNAAIYLRRPLLVSGDPGIGKSSLAKSIAKYLTSKPLLTWHITSKSELKDAQYHYDALARLYEIQIAKHNGTTDPLPLSDFMTLGALGEAFVDIDTRVVLIDEIDKCDVDLPNDLLHMFEEQKFYIPEVKRSKIDLDLNIEDIGDVTIEKSGWLKCQNDFPIIIMTSNGERDFPPAFLRRCIRIDMSLPTDDTARKEELEKMIQSHFGNTKYAKYKDNIDKLITYFTKHNTDDNKLSNDQLLNAVHIVTTDGNVDKKQILQKLN